MSAHWNYHGIWELLLLKGLQLRGANIDYYACTGGIKQCVHTRLLHQDDCVKCKQRMEMNIKKWDIAYNELYQNIDDIDIIASQWLESLDEDNIQNACFENYEVSKWIMNPFLLRTRLPEYSYGHDEYYDSWFKIMLKDSVVSILSCKSILDRKDYSSLIIFNGMNLYSWSFCILAKERGIKLYIHERGHIQNTYKMSDTPLLEDISSDTWEYYKDIPLKSNELNRVNLYLNTRKASNKFTSDYVLNTGKRDIDIRSKYAIEEEKVWVLFTSSTFEMNDIMTGTSRTHYPMSQWEFIYYVIYNIKKHENLHLIIRVHPHSGLKNGGSPSECEFFKRLKKKNESNNKVTIIEADEECSSYSLMEIADASINYTSTCCLEMLSYGKPSLFVGLYGDIFPDLQIQGIDDIAKKLDWLASFPAGYADNKFRTTAFRYWNHRLRYSFHTSFLQSTEPHKMVTTFSSFDELLPGNDLIFDDLCDKILSKRNLVLPPDPEDTWNSTSAEIEFFKNNPPIFYQTNDYTLTDALNSVPVLRKFGFPTRGYIGLILCKKDLINIQKIIQNDNIAHRIVAIALTDFESVNIEAIKVLMHDKTTRDIPITDIKSISSLYHIELVCYFSKRDYGTQWTTFEYLSKIGRKNYYYIHEADPFPVYPEYLDKNRRSLERIFDSLSDLQSKNIFAGRIKAMLTGIAGYLQSSQFPCYFHPKLPFYEGYVVIDGGACGGEPSKTYSSLVGSSGKVLAFEAGMDIFDETQNIIKGYDNINLYSYGLWSCDTTMKYNNAGGSGSAVNIPRNSETISLHQFVSIDSFMKTHKQNRLDHIKMDIEGAELTALRGATVSIQKYKPDLSICLYHKLEDIYSIPEFILDLNLGYKIYLGGHNQDFSDDIVLYATARS